MLKILKKVKELIKNKVEIYKKIHSYNNYNVEGKDVCRFSIKVLIFIVVINLLLGTYIRSGLIENTNYYLSLSMIIEAMVGYLYLGIYNRLYSKASLTMAVCFVFYYAILKTMAFTFQAIIPIPFIWDILCANIFIYIFYTKKENILF